MPRPPRVRPGNADDQAQLRAAILGSAFTIYQRGGLPALTMRAVAAGVGLSAMGLYRHYADKAALLQAMWEVVLGEARAEVLAGVAVPGATARQRLRASTDASLRYWERHPDHFRLVFMTEQTIAEGRDARLTEAEAYRQVVDLSAPLIEAFARETGIDPGRALAARDLRLALMVGYLHARIVNRRFPWTDLDALRAATLDAIEAGVEQVLRGGAAAQR